MHRSKFDIRGADAGAGGMSIRSGSGGASGMGASSSSSDASAMAQSTGSSGVGSGSMCMEKSASWAWSAAASVTASRTSPSLWARKRRQPVVHTWFSSHKSVAARDAHSAEDWRRHAERHTHCRVRDDSVPVLHVEPIRARLRQLRVVVQELEQDDDEVVTPRPDPRHCGHEQNKSANWGKRPTDKRKKEKGLFYYRKISGEGIILCYSFILIQKNQRLVKLQTVQFYINSKTICTTSNL